MVAVGVMIVVTGAVLLWLDGSRTERHHEIPANCTSIIAMSPSGHRMLTARVITEDNADEMNRCMQAVGITNVRIARNLSASPRYVLPEKAHRQDHT